jgi:hypothetical protein
MILRSEWGGEVACEQVITNKERIDTKQFTACEAVFKLAT